MRPRPAPARPRRLTAVLALALPLVFPLATGCRSTPEPQASAPRADETPRDKAHAAQAGRPGTWPGKVGKGTPLAAAPGNQLAIFAAGCFWGVESRFREVPGVVATAVGYTGGKTSDPTYPEVCTHTTGHAEAVLVEFDPAKVTYEQLLGVFWEGHDPTTLDRQGPDEGDQYRSAIFTVSPGQAAAAQASMAKEQRRLARKIVTQIVPAAPFFAAEDYHQQYHEKTGTHACPTGRAPVVEGI
jgi:peptide-methionine (S)-S-oxide reductase